MVIARASGVGKIGKRAAERLAWELVLSKLEANSAAPGAQIKLKDFVTHRFSPERMWALKPTGKQHYDYILGTHVLPALGSIRLRDFNPSMLSVFFRQKQATGYDRQIRTGTTKEGEPIYHARHEQYSGQTLAHIRNVLSAIFRHARNCGMYSGQLPTEGLRLPRIENRERGALTADEATAIITALPGQYGTLAALLLTTGLRIGEGAGLRWKSIDFATGCLTVRESYVNRKWSSPKTKNSIRTVPVPAAVLASLAALRIRESLTGPDDPVFITGHGNPLDARTTASKILKPIARKIGMGWVSWHSFRHSNASFADQAGMTVAERRKALGHGSDSMAMKYTHTDLELVRAKVEAVAAAVLPRGKERVM
jgi:integrase